MGRAKNTCSLARIIMSKSRNIMRAITTCLRRNSGLTQTRYSFNMHVGIMKVHGYDLQRQPK